MRKFGVFATLVGVVFAAGEAVAQTDTATSATSAEPSGEMPEPTYKLNPAPVERLSTDADRGPQPAFRLALNVDLPIILIGGGLASSFFLKDEAEAPRCAPLCDRANINAFDRGAAGWYDPTWGRVGDIATASTLLFGPVLLLFVEGLENGANDALVVMESALSASALQVITSYAITRPRPRVYGEKAPVADRDDANASRSFFSGHMANVVAATVATSVAFQRIDEPGWAWATLAIGGVGSAAVGAGRIGAGSHFPSDVLIGLAVGVGLGIAVPALHDSPVRVAPLAYEEGGGGLSLAGGF